MSIHKKKIKNLSVSGGGFFGFAEIAALKELEKYKDYFDIQNMNGVSVGSMVVALYAVGYGLEELSQILFEFNFDKLIKDGMLPYIRLYEKYGMYEACRVEEEIEILIRNKTNIRFCTFSQIKINLTIVSTNLNMQSPRLFSKENTPEMPISKAVRLSIGYPLVMTPILFENDYYGDGGIYMNYPIILFEKQLEETIGITFAAYNENNDGTLKTRIPINDVYDYIKSLGLTMSRSAYVSQISQKYLDRSIIINIDQNIGSMQFNLTKEQKMFIYDCGTKATNNQIGKILGISNIPKIIEPKPATDVVFDSPNDDEIRDAVKHLMAPVPEICNLINDI